MNNIGPPIPIVSESAARAERYRQKANTYQRTNALQRHKIKRLEAALVEIMSHQQEHTAAIARKALQK